MPTAYVTHSDCSRHDTGWAHPEHQGRLAAVSRAVYRDMLTLFDELREVEAVPATEEDLQLAHEARYVGRVRAAAAAAARAGETLPFEGDVRVSGATWDAVRAAAGAGITAVDAVLRAEVGNAFCAVRPPGNQAGIAGPGGFGIFNTVAIAARHLRERRGLDRVLIVEWGAAAGRGTAEIAARDPGVRFASVHQRTGSDPRDAAPPHGGVATRAAHAMEAARHDGSIAGWPGSPAVAPVDAGAGGAEVLSALESVLRDATADFQPQFVLLSLGLDALAGDPVGGLSLAPLDAFTLTGPVMELAADLCEGRLVSVLEGGYDAPATGTAVVQHLRALAGLSAA